MERKTGFEPATTTLARWGSTGLSYFRSLGPDSVFGEAGWILNPLLGERQATEGGSHPRVGGEDPAPDSPPRIVSSHRPNPLPIRREAFVSR